MRFNLYIKKDGWLGLFKYILKGLDKAQDTLIDKYGSVGLLLDITV